jgi:hypothetical protein
VVNEGQIGAIGIAADTDNLPPAPFGVVTTRPVYGTDLVFGTSGAHGFAKRITPPQDTVARCSGPGNEPAKSQARNQESCFSRLARRMAPSCHLDDLTPRH